MLRERNPSCPGADAGGTGVSDTCGGTTLTAFREGKNMFSECVLFRRMCFYPVSVRECGLRLSKYGTFPIYLEHVYLKVFLDEMYYILLRVSRCRVNYMFC